MNAPRTSTPSFAATAPGCQSDIGLCRQMGHDLRQSLHGLGMLAGVLVLQSTDATMRETLGYVEHALADLQQTLDHYTGLARQGGAAGLAGTHPGLTEAPPVVIGERPLPLLDALLAPSNAMIVRHASVDAFLADAGRPRPPACLIGLPTNDTLAPVLGCLLAFKGCSPETTAILVPPEPPLPWLGAVAELGGLCLLEPQPEASALQAFLGVSPAPFVLDFGDSHTS